MLDNKSYKLINLLLTKFKLSVLIWMILHKIFIISVCDLLLVKKKKYYYFHIIKVQGHKIWNLFHQFKNLFTASGKGCN